MVAALCLDAAPNPDAIALLKQRNWQIEVIRDVRNFQAVLEIIKGKARKKPDVVLLGQKINAQQERPRVMFWETAVQRLSDVGITTFIPFADEDDDNRSMFEAEAALKVKMLDFLGVKPFWTIFDEADEESPTLQALEEQIMREKSGRKEQA